MNTVEMGEVFLTPLATIREPLDLHVMGRRVPACTLHVVCVIRGVGAKKRRKKKVQFDTSLLLYTKVTISSRLPWSMVRQSIIEAHCC
jgi:hypothetical protein